MNFYKFCFLFVMVAVNGQSKYSISADFAQAAGKEVRLSGFDFANSPIFSQATADSNGLFTLNYPADYSGAALIEVKGVASVIVLLNKENFSIRWSELADYNSLTFTNSVENNAFNQGLQLYKDVSAKQRGLEYLIPLYNNDLVTQHQFRSELLIQNEAIDQFLELLPSNSYSRYYLNLRTLLTEIQRASSGEKLSSSADNRFKNIDFGDIRLVRSGLFKELLDHYFVAAEARQNSDSVNSASDLILSKLNHNSMLKQNVAEHLFKLFEMRSLFAQAEHIAILMLNDAECTVDDRRQALFEQYRKMANGKIAPEIIFANSNSKYKNLSAVNSAYKLVVFGAGWCMTCEQEVPKLLEHYPKWKSRKMEVIYVSLDTDKQSFINFTRNFPWVTSSDFQSWEGAAARDYYVSGTPTMYLLDGSNMILLKPISPDQVSAWLDMQQ